MEGDDLVGKWLVGDRVGRDSARAFVRSFAIFPPVTIGAFQDSPSVQWMTLEANEGWRHDVSLKIQCIESRNDAVFILHIPNMKVHIKYNT